MEAGLRKEYTHLFFDLDHTLWDYRRNAGESLQMLYNDYQIKNFTDHSLDDFIDTFHEVNYKLWNQYHFREIPKSMIRKERFRILGEKLAIHNFNRWNDFQNDFIQDCPTRGHLYEGAIELLDMLKGTFRISLITNGFDDIQKKKIHHAGLDGYFEHTITSEKANYQKPQPGIFHYAFDITQATPLLSLMIGDDQHSDIYGARNVNMDQVLFNPDRMEVKTKPTYEIFHLSELKSLLIG